MNRRRLAGEAQLRAACTATHTSHSLSVHHLHSLLTMTATARGAGRLVARFMTAHGGSSRPSSTTHQAKAAHLLEWSTRRTSHPGTRPSKGRATRGSSARRGSSKRHTGRAAAERRRSSGGSGDQGSGDLAGRWFISTYRLPWTCEQRREGGSEHTEVNTSEQAQGVLAPGRPRTPHLVHVRPVPRAAPGAAPLLSAA